MARQRVAVVVVPVRVKAHAQQIANEKHAIPQAVDGSNQPSISSLHEVLFRIFRIYDVLQH